MDILPPGEPSGAVAAHGVIIHLSSFVRALFFLSSAQLYVCLSNHTPTRALLRVFIVRRADDAMVDGPRGDTGRKELFRLSGKVVSTCVTIGREGS